MTTLFSFCDIHWIFPWLLPFLLGLALGYLLWARYKSMVADLQADLNSKNEIINGLNADLKAAISARSECEGSLSLLKGRISEMEATASSPSAALGLVTQAGMSTMGARSGGDDRYFLAIGDDKLQIIEGIGPKMEEVLKSNGYTSFALLSSVTPSSLRAMLDKYGDKYRIIDPTTWPQQAQLAQDRKWDDLIELQKNLDTGRSDVSTDGQTDSKLEKFLIKAGVLKKWAQDDLKAIEGIGPKIEELFHNAGIKTWQALSDTSTDRMQQILTEAGPRYQLADPGTWAKQAAMAAAGQWQELQAYQDALNAGKE